LFCFLNYREAYDLSIRVLSGYRMKQ